jgi:hypothetical protein
MRWNIPDFQKKNSSCCPGVEGGRGSRSGWQGGGTVPIGMRWNRSDLYGVEQL